MKKAIYIFLLLIPLLSWGQKEYSLKGTDFWVTVPNGIGIDSILLQVCSHDTCTAVFSFNGNSIVRHSERRPIDNLEYAEFYYGSYGNNFYGSDTLHEPIISLTLPAHYAHTGQTDTILNKSIHITTTDSAFVHLYAFGTNGGATSVIPTHALQPEYIVQTWADSYGAAFVILATEDNTVIDIVLTNPSTDNLEVNTTHTLHLNAGNTYQLITDIIPSSLTGTFTGTQISARGNKKIAVFQSNRQLTRFYTNRESDYTLEQALPIAYAGKSFNMQFMFTSEDIGSIITSTRDNCILTHNGQPIDTLNAAESYYLDHSNYFFNTLETSQPVIVCLFSSYHQRPVCSLVMPIESGGYDGFISPDYYYTTKKYLPSPPNPYYTYTNDPIYLYPPTSPYDSIWLANSPILFHIPVIFNLASSWFSIHSKQERFFAHKIGSLRTITIDYDNHDIIFDNPNSYSYAVCYNMILWNKIFYGDSIPNNALAFASFCLDHEITFNTNCDTNQTYFHWDFGDGHTAVGPVVRHTYANPGTYQVQAIIDFANTPLSDHTRDTILGTINISNHDTITQYDSCCIFPYQWDDTLISAPGTYLRHTPGTDDCFQIDRLILSVDTSSVRTSFFDTICQDDSITWHQHSYTTPGTYYDTLSQINGCDSILQLNLSVWSRPDVTIEQLSPDGQLPIQLQGTVHNPFGSYRLNWDSSPDDPSLLGQEHLPLITVSPTENTRYNLTAKYDSLPDCYGHNQYYIKTLANSTLWIPNIFTPDKEPNTTFNISATGLSEYHISIFNRHGERIFHSDDINSPWDGTSSGIKCPEGTYVYSITYSTKETPNSLQTTTGTVTLIR